MNTLKLKIKELAESQKELRNQRKTVYLIGERVVEPWQAVEMHKHQRHELRLLYAAYGLMRGKSFYKTETSTETIHPLEAFRNEIDSIVRKYSETVCTSE